MVFTQILMVAVQVGNREMNRDHRKRPESLRTGCGEAGTPDDIMEA